MATRSSSSSSARSSSAVMPSWNSGQSVRARAAKYDGVPRRRARRPLRHARARVGRTGARSRACGSAPRRGVVHLHERLIHELFEQVEHLHRREPLVGHDGLGGIEGERRREDGQTPQQECCRFRRAASGSTRSKLRSSGGAAARPAGPPASMPIVLPSPSRICAGVRTRQRAAASSMASGMPSRRAQISATVAALSSCRRKFCLPLMARSAKRRTASYCESAATGSRRAVARDRERRDPPAQLARHVERGAARREHGDARSTMPGAWRRRRRSRRGGARSCRARAACTSCSSARRSRPTDHRDLRGRSWRAHGRRDQCGVRSRPTRSTHQTPSG